MGNKKYVQKYIIPPVIAASLVLSPMLTENVSAKSYYTVGDTGANVISLQENLQDFGFYTDVDGSYGPDTRRTVLNFQRAHGLQVDGIAGPETLGTLNKQASNNSGSSSNSSVEYYSYGDRGTGVTDVQTNLNKHEFTTDVDGIYGPDTRQKVRSFQRANNLQVDGIAGPETLKALNKKASNNSGSSNSSSVEYYSYGDRGSGVSDVQSNLNKHGFSTDVDGSYGPDTRQKVRSFQRANNLQVDGIAGPETLKALSQKPSGNSNGSNDSSDSSESSSQQDIAATARGLVGSPYVFGGTTPSGFDSSGFINYVFSQHGIQLSRTHASMWTNNGVSVDKPQIGDVVFYQNTYQPGVSHSGIYIGNNQMVHAGTSATGVEVTNMNYNYWKSRYIGAKSFQ